MVEYITGINGVGKTRIMCEACINTAAESKGNVIFIDASDKLSTRLPSNIRLINVSDFGIEGATALCGFLVGLCASDYDLTDIFFDSTIDIINNNNTNLLFILFCVLCIILYSSFFRFLKGVFVCNS